MIRIPKDLSRVLRQGGTVIVPSRQRAHALRLAYAAAQIQGGQRVWNTPDVLTLDAWIAREIEAHATTAGVNVPRMLSSAEDWLLWRQCTAEATREWDLVNRSALAEALRRASALAADNRIDVYQFPPIPGTEPGLLQDVQRAVDARCRELDATALASAGHYLPSSVDTTRIRIAGFLRISPRFAALMRVSDDRRLSAASAALKRPQVVIAPDGLTELERIAKWCRAHIERRPDARLLVVLPGSAGARERLATLIRQTVDSQNWLASAGADSVGSSSTIVAIEGGSPLGRDPAVAHALSSLRWLCGEAGEFEAISEWLRAPYWNRPDAGARARLDAWLRERARMQFDLPALAAELRVAPPSRAPSGAQEIIKQISDAAAVLGHGRRSVQEWSQRFRAALAVFGWPGERVRDSRDQQTVIRFHELLDEFGQLSQAAGPLTREAAGHWLTELAARTPYQAADEDPVVTITPMFADPIVHYDGLWVAGLQSEVLPQPVQPDPFLPLPSQLAAGVPAASAAGRLEEAQSLLAAWRAASDEVVLSAPATSEDLDLLPSPLLVQWLPQSRRSRTSGQTAPAALEPLWLPVRMRRPGWLEAMDDRVGLEWDVERPLPAGTTSLERQNTCPFRAYAELRLGSSELGAPDPGVDPKMRGKLLHGALQRLWAHIGDSQALRALPEAAESELIDRCVSDAAKEMIWGDAQDAPPRARERRRALRLIRSLCQLERERAPFRVIGTELERPLNLPLKGPLGPATARLNVRIDRIDRLESGGCAILDYKSGQARTTDWYGERPSHPQLLAYLAAIDEDVVALATVNVTAREVRFDGIASSSRLLPKVKGVIPPEGGDGDAWELRKGEWLECVERLAAGFVSGNAAVDPKQGACEHCHVKSVCRVGDRADPEPELLEEMPDE